jgi:hypothetical protein
VSLRDAKFTDVDFSGVEVADSNVARMRIDGISVEALFAAYRKNN